MTDLQETTVDRLMRYPLSLAYTLHPKRARHAPRFAVAAALSLARGGVHVPSPGHVVPVDMLFGGVARNVTPEAVLAAGRRGFFLESHAGPQKWWTLEQRMVVDPNAVHIGKRLRPQIRNANYRFTLDQDFHAVLRGCAEGRPERVRFTWIRQDIADVYTALFDMGHAHSFEVWDADGALIGGGYGLAVGRVFVLESMFHRANNASKIGLVALNHHLSRLGFALNDAKAFGPLYDRLGYRTIARTDYEALLQRHAGPEHDQAGRWEFGTDLDTVSRWKPGADR